MLIKKDIKLIRSLRLKKYRQKYNKFIVEGEKNAIEAIKYNNTFINSIYCTEKYALENERLLTKIKQNPIIITEKELSQISNLKTANLVLIVMNISNEKISFDKSKVIVYLDDITDPGNMGTIIRTCDWFGVDLLIISPNSVDIYNPKVIQSSMGSIFRLPIKELEFENIHDELKSKNFTFYGTMLKGESIYDLKYNFPLVMIIGNESKGISELISKKINNAITIPRYNKKTESLNAAIATGIVLADMNTKLNR